MKFHSNMYGWEYIWREFAEDRKGELVLDESHPGTPTIVALVVPAGNQGHKMTFTPFLTNGKKPFESTSATLTFTRNSLDMVVRTEHKFDQLHKVLGLQDIIIGDPAFDKKFLIQGNDEHRVRTILTDSRLREMMTYSQQAELRVFSDATAYLPADRVQQGHSAVVFSQEVLADKFDMLESIFNIAARTLHLVQVPADARSHHATSSSSSHDEVSSQRRFHSPLLDA